MPIKTQKIMPIFTVNLIISPSLPSMFVTEAASTISVGENIFPIAPPAVCDPSISSGFIPRFFAVVYWKAPSSIFELVLLPVMNVPRAPIIGEKNGNRKNVAF